MSVDSETNVEGTHHVTILPLQGWSLPNFRELFRYRDLLYLLTVRNIAVIYRQSILGIGWAIVRPLISTIIFALVFGRFAGFANNTNSIAYPLFVLSGLVIWNYFATALANASESVVSQANLLTKTYFPRLLLPISAIAVASVDFLVQLTLLICLMFFYQVTPSFCIFMLPLFFLAATVCAMAIGVWLTALNVRFRDVKHVVPFLIQTLFYLSPVIYPASFVPHQWRWALNLNPMFSVVQGFRWSLLGTEPPDWILFGVSLLFAVLLLISGLVFFQRTESTFADVI